ncbi:MAG: hypothetical protein FRX48_05789 [Lasallia pustulata]|uniref:SPX domain-containing protein n=1 Tax=Lasallia pustulata TaxID=136370 RepID=A0A5M8PN00_9LECA|nr:MAG: hypothetical protein FRX48_05789 [Lasallia pustulata]
MKYGDTLHQRSIPEWGTYNVDYNDIKHLIKVRTTRGQAEAVSIPGHGHESKALRDFEEELYAELHEQHQRIDLFVQSKSGEIARRLTHLHKQIAQLKQRNLPTDRTRISVRRLEKFSKAEEDALKAGEDLQSLARFVGAQRLAFQKLLKKYRRWTGSSTLGTRFQQDVLSRPSTFSTKDFEPLLTQWTDVLAAVRAPFAAGATWTTEPTERTERRGNQLEGSNTAQAVASNGAITSRGGPSEDVGRSITSAAQIHAISETGSDVDFDTALAVLPLGRAAGRAAYWVHPDNLVELHVLLLQYMSPRRTGNPSTSESNQSSSKSSRKGLMDGRGNGFISISEEETFVIICDDLRRFAERRSNATVSESENAPGATSEAAAASIRYTSKSEAVVVVGTSSDAISKKTARGTRQSVQKVKLKRRFLPLLFVPGKQSNDTSGKPASVSETDETGDEIPKSTHAFERVRRWLSHHEDVKPLISLRSRRTRFVGLRNSETNGVWGTLDHNVSMKKAPFDQVKDAGSSGDLLETSKDESERFPHAILEVRWEGEAYASLARALDESHLTERARGFSLETHAVAKLYKPEGMPPPFWLAALDHDIRKVPSPAKLARSSNSKLSRDSPSTRPTSTSATSQADGPTSSGFSAILHESSTTSLEDTFESPPLSSFKKKRRARKQHPLRKPMGTHRPSQFQRYWNEFDDGDEAPEEEPYTLFVDPNESSAFPGAAALSHLATVITSHAQHQTEKIRSWFHPQSTTPLTSDRAPLIPSTSSYFSPRPKSQPSSPDSDFSVFPSRLATTHRQYSTFAPKSDSGPRYYTRPHALARDRLLATCALFSFLTALLLLGIALVLASTGRRKDGLAVDAGVVAVLWDCEHNGSAVIRPGKEFRTHGTDT